MPTFPFSIKITTPTVYNRVYIPPIVPKRPLLSQMEHFPPLKSYWGRYGGGTEDKRSRMPDLVGLTYNFAIPAKAEIQIFLYYQFPLPSFINLI